MGITTKILAILTAIGAAILAVFSYRSGKASAESKAKDEEVSSLKEEAKRAEEVSSQSAKAHNEAVDQANAARKEIDEKHDQNVAAVSAASAVSLRDGSNAVNSAIDSANGGV